jgi:hypothetical protein
LMCFITLLIMTTLLTFLTSLITSLACLRDYADASIKATLLTNVYK